MTILHFFFYASFGILFYSYLGYGGLLWLFTRKPVRQKKQLTDEQWPAVTIIIAAYNEAAILDQKISNTVSIDYPAHRFKILVVTDGSTDESAALVSRYPSVKGIHYPERKGKYAAIRHAMKEVDTPLVVFTDANTLLNPECIKRIVPHYQDPAVGGVAGEKKIRVDAQNSAVGQAEGLYWRYESFMKKMDARFFTVVGAAGELFSIRTALFTPAKEEWILDDFMMAMHICLQDYKMAYEPGAYATEAPSVSLAEEQKRKIRIAAGAYQAAARLGNAINIFRHPRLAFQYFSRRILRWFFCPLALVLFLVSNIGLVLQHPESLFFQVLLLAQLFYYLLSLAGWLMLRAGKKAGLLGIPYYFLFMNSCLIKGFILYHRGQQTVLWEKAERQAN